MSEIRQLYIKNFRSIKELLWYPNPGLNCLIGPGDAGKSTILDAIDLALGARNSYPFTDADFYHLDTTAPIEISVTFGALDEQLKNFDTYGFFLRSFDLGNKFISDEPQHGQELVLTIKLTVDEDLNPDWLLYSERAESDGVERRLPWKHRELVTPTRLGTTSHQHLSWGSRSVLNKLTEGSLDVSSTLASLSRQTRQTFSEKPFEDVNDVLKKVQEIAEGLGVSVGELRALLDVKGVSLSNGAISLHDYNNTPLRQLGTGSSRLLISGLQKEASKSNIIIVDEAEYGLEPFRITRLLNELGSKEEHPSKQVFITTHSPYVLRELQAKQLHVVRHVIPPPPPTEFNNSHYVYSLGDGDHEQATLRACAEAFFSRAVIVGEGKTEVGLIKGMDLYYTENGETGIHAKGASCADGGGGDNYFKRAEVFQSLGYPTAILQDSDISTPAHLAKVKSCQDKGIIVFEWGYGASTEGALFAWCSTNMLPLLVNYAAQLYGNQKIDQHIINSSTNQYNLKACLDNPIDEMRLALTKAAGDYKWFKDITKAEDLARNIIGPNLTLFNKEFSGLIKSIFSWADANGNFR